MSLHIKINPDPNRYISLESYNISTFSYGIIITMGCPSDWQCRRGYGELANTTK